MNRCPALICLVWFVTAVPIWQGAFAESLACQASSPATHQVSPILGNDEAIARAISSQPDLLAAECRIAAAGGRITQAETRPNPEAAVELENFAGNGDATGLTSVETTLQVSQLIELGDKRGKRIRVAGLDRDLEVWNRESKRLDVIARTRKAFVTVVGAQQRVEVAEDLVGLAEEVVRVVTARIKAGKVSPVEGTRARVAATRTRIEVARSRSELEAARRRLAAQWDADEAVFERADEDLEHLGPVPAFEVLSGRLEMNPDLARWATEMELRRAQLRLAESQRTPDITVGGGIRHFAEPDDVGLVASISVPLPLFNRGQGDIAEARFLALATEADQRSARIRLLTDLYDAYEHLKSARAEVAITRDEVLPVAKEAYEATVAGYRHGKFAYADVLEAQRTLFDARTEYIDALIRYHAARADLDRLAGSGMSSADHVPGADTTGDRS